ncbi:type I-E CRISPR-associated protein Cse2/CasB [Actinacidiphila oryziradicis]|uniref:CRISPR-associated protein Cse2 n=1 Tax=Actinacidiphila oryziradicis TaxID=2571141 RepID=A0A4U0RTY7_9ACTN|nr:type I-E CRISPR-associated protein Cse2/CasB [Actinacidiphila oryziradicis]TJZ99595.1 CRISPR-associated protein Cse2 [Actinacidiphila oryziradicis]
MITTEQRRAHYDTFATTDVPLLCASPGFRADLRSGRGREVTQCPRMHRHLARLVAGYGACRAHYTVASLIALRRPAPRPAPAAPTGPLAQDRDTDPGPSADSAIAWTERPWRSRPNLGASLADAVRRRGMRPGPTEDRLHLLTRLSEDLLHPRLPRLIDHLLDSGAGVDWPVLLEDLAWWEWDREAVTLRWLDSYYLALPLPAHAQER